MGNEAFPECRDSSLTLGMTRFALGVMRRSSFDRSCWYGGQTGMGGEAAADGFGEGVIAAPLEGVAKAYPDLSLGSYPFFGEGGFGAHLVVRGRDAEEIEAAVVALEACLRAAGVDRVTRVEMA